MTTGMRANRAGKRRRRRAHVPALYDLTDDACVALLERNSIMRLAYSFRDQVDIEPLHYVVEGRWVYGRTSHGSKLAPIAHHHWVAFEVDEVDGPYDWRSVVGHGALYVLPKDGSPLELRARRKALRLLRRVVPDALGPDDPTPHRTVIFRIYIDALTGKAASTGVGAGDVVSA